MPAAGFRAIDTGLGPVSSTPLPKPKNRQDDSWLADKEKHNKQITHKILTQHKKEAINTLTARREMMEDIKSTLLKRVQEKLSEATLTANEMNLLANAVVKIDTMDSGAIETADSEREALEKVVEALEGAICRDN